MAPIAFRLTAALFCFHAFFLVLSLPDYFVGIDSGYHVSLARWYGEHGTAWWDHINFGPGGRPNLQGPLMHAAVGYFGRLLGGDGMDYVNANACLALVQWLAAMGTAWYFARRYGGDWAALFAVALLSGALFTSVSFSVGIPSGWVFIFSVWAAWFFVERRLAPSVLCTSAAIYAHLAGYAMAPLGVLVAAILLRRWKDLAIVGVAVAILTSPYTIHFLRHLEWYRGKKGDTALLLAPLVLIPAAVGIVRLLRRPRENAFLVAVLIAPAPWLVQDYTRYLMQAPLVLAVIAGIELARWRDGLTGRRRPAFAALLVALATLYPFSLPSLALEVMWNFGPKHPRMIDWPERRLLAETIRGAGLDRRLVNAYNPTHCIALAVFAPLTFQGGHWVEVQPPERLRRRLSAGAKVYVLPVPAADPVLQELAALQLLTIHGGSDRNSIVTLREPPPLDAAAREFARVGAAEAEWLARFAKNNRMPDVGELLSVEAIAKSRARSREQRTRAGRIKAAALVYAVALEMNHADRASHARGVADGFGEMANLLGDEATLDFRSEASHRRLQANLAAWAEQLRTLPATLLVSPELERATRELMEHL